MWAKNHMGKLCVCVFVVNKLYSKSKRQKNGAMVGKKNHSELFYDFLVYEKNNDSISHSCAKMLP